MQYPEAEPNPAQNTIGGITYQDPFQWLEEDSDEVRAWESAQNELAGAEIRTFEGWDRLREIIDRTFVEMFSYYAPRQVGGRWWRQLVPEGRGAPVIQVAAEISGPWQDVVDVNAEPGDDANLSFWTPSPDGSRLVYGVGVGGCMPHARVIDVASGDVLLDGLPHYGAYFFAWLPDSSGFFHNAMEVRQLEDGTTVAESRIYRVTLDEPLPTEAEPIELPHPAAWPVVSTDGRYALAVISQTDPRPVHIKNLEDDSGWRPFLLEREGLCKGAVVGERYVAIVDDISPLGRVVSIPLATPTDESTWTELVPAGEAKLASVTPVGDRLVLGEFVDGFARLRILDHEGGERAIVPLPGDGAVGRFALGYILSIMDDLVYSDDDGLTFVYSSLTTAPASYRYHLKTGDVERLSDPAVRLDGVELVSLIATSRDGTRVPYRVLRPAGGGGPRPTIITGYGGFNVPWLPAYSAMAAAWVRAGGVWVHGHLRGGGEFGADWWRGGRMHVKQNTFDDLYAVAEDLVASGVCSSETLGVWGSSNGGLLAGAALTQRPDLFRAAVPQVPILDLLRCKFDQGSIGIAMADYGNPDDPGDARAMYAYSPYHNVGDGRAYPAVLLDAGRNDTTCPPWHSRKMAARLQRATTSGRPILLRVRERSGHNAMSEAEMKARDLEELAFFAAQLGLDP